MIRTFLTLLLISFNIYFTNGQDYQYLNSIEGFKGSFTTDYLGNIFSYYSGDLIRYDSDGNKTGVFSSREYGDISSVDATNPMKILVVYNDFSKAVLLDNGLAANVTFDLMLPGVPAFSIICSARDAGFWIYDPNNNQLKKLNDQLQVTTEGTNLRQISDTDIEPLSLLDSGDWLVMYAKDMGFMVFDRYGTYFKTINRLYEGGFQVNNDDLIIKDDIKMQIINIKTGRIQQFLLPENEPGDECRIENKRIYLKQKQTLKIYGY